MFKLIIVCRPLVDSATDLGDREGVFLNSCVTIVVGGGGRGSSGRGTVVQQVPILASHWSTDPILTSDWSTGHHARLHPLHRHLHRVLGAAPQRQVEPGTGRLCIKYSRIYIRAASCTITKKALRNPLLEPPPGWKRLLLIS